MKLKSVKCAIKIAAALAFTTAAGSAMAWHDLKIMMDGPATGSLFIVGDPQFGGPLQGGLCITPPPGTSFPRGWYDTNYLLKDGSNVKAIAFSSKDCHGYRRENHKKVPGYDRLFYVYLPLF